MPTKQFKPTSPGRRGMIGFTFEEITKKTPERRLLVPKKQKAGRNQQGRITVRHRGGGAKRHLRIIDFKRDKFGVPGKVAAIGWCYGGGVALSYALGSEHHEATAIFYGRLLDDPERLAAIRPRGGRHVCG